jgi:phosphatidylserine/phosphatidylglycerophosphate/cardiolipin synthase-like enzyme
MKKNIFNTVLIYSLLGAGLTTSTGLKAAEALFSPARGDEAFNRMYSMIAEAKKSVKMTIYSWSEAGLKDAIKTALNNGVSVQIVLHPPLAAKASIKTWVEELEGLGAVFKKANMNMHEKFLIIDGEKLVNSSANISSGARRKYSENWVFFNLSHSEKESKLIQEFIHEFSLMWNVSEDIRTNNDEISLSLNEYPKDNISTKNEIENLLQPSTLYLASSSMNFKYAPTDNYSTHQSKAKYVISSKKTVNGEHTMIVKDEIIKRIREAKKTIYAGLNHFNIADVSHELIAAVKRGVEVKLAVDNQEYKSKINNKEMTPLFVRDWKALPGNEKKEIPVRVKFYSLAPSPKYWLLNHHKFFVIDHASDKPVVISGSYNISKTAEQNQYDSMVIFEGKDFKNLALDFEQEFNSLWQLERNQDDQPKWSALDPMLKNEDSIKIHLNEAVSLKWEEVEKVRSIIRSKAPGAVIIPHAQRDCMFYNIKTKQFSGC